MNRNFLMLLLLVFVNCGYNSDGVINNEVINNGVNNNFYSVSGVNGWDYNMDGVEEKQINNVYFNCNNMPEDLCRVVSGNIDTISPESFKEVLPYALEYHCGYSGKFKSCNFFKDRGCGEVVSVKMSFIDYPFSCSRIAKTKEECDGVTLIQSYNNNNRYYGCEWTFEGKCINIIIDNNGFDFTQKCR